MATRRSSFGRRVWHAAAATLVAFGLVGVATHSTWNFNVLNPVGELLADFRYTDLYYELHGPEPLDDHLVLVNIGGQAGHSRDSLAAVLRALRPCHPRAVGLDVRLPPRPDPGNAALAAAIHELPQLVVGLYLQKQPGNVLRPEATEAALQPVTTGFLNVQGDKKLNTTVRAFHPFHHEVDAVYLSWAAQLLQRYDSSAYADLKSRHLPEDPQPEEIRYRGNGNSFLHLEARELLADTTWRSRLRGKLVLLGVMGEHAAQPDSASSCEDCLFTPLNSRRLGRSQPDMYGVVVEANILAMLLHRTYIQPAPVWLEWLLAGSLCLGLILLFGWVEEYHPRWNTPVNRLVQFSLLLGLILLVVLAYGARSPRSFNITLSLAVLALVGDAMAWYAAGRDLLRNGRTHWQHRRAARRPARRPARSPAPPPLPEAPAPPAAPA